ncbi:glycosyltransferase [Paenisporosarcina sp. TG20]|uniref:glycosyltransferase n=1 Tax=Paenisporosarcina sp. TG20 TaxID=1211706 RepID=UPI0002F300E9|nr:glycosyltransferase [Paenisporosarcina sp. TG20]
MKIVLALPYFPQPRGNTVTVQRIADGLVSLGVQTDIFSTTEEKISNFIQSADLVHGFHAYQFYKFMQKLDNKPESYVVTLTGTDLNHDLFNPDRRNDVLASLNGAKAIHVFEDKAKDILVGEAPRLKDKIYTIVQGVSSFPIKKCSFIKEPNSFLFVLPAGVRKVKNIPFAITALYELHKKMPNIRLWLVGPILEEEEGKIVLELVKRHCEWITYIGQVPHVEMGCVYDTADAVLNTSHSEGQPCAILEAMSYELPVIASNIQGNRSIISNGKTGLLFNGQDEFIYCAEKVINNHEIRETIGQSAKAYVAEHHSSSAEAEALLKIYRNILE